MKLVVGLAFILAGIFYGLSAYANSLSSDYFTIMFGLLGGMTILFSIMFFIGTFDKSSKGEKKDE